MQHLLRIDPKEAVSDIIWDTAERLVHRATLLENREDAARLLRAPSVQSKIFCHCQHRSESSPSRKQSLNAMPLSPPPGPPPPPNLGMYTKRKQILQKSFTCKGVIFTPFFFHFNLTKICTLDEMTSAYYSIVLPLQLLSQIFNYLHTTDFTSHSSVAKLASKHATQPIKCLYKQTTCALLHFNIQMF